MLNQHSYNMIVMLLTLHQFESYAINIPLKFDHKTFGKFLLDIFLQLDDDDNGHDGVNDDDIDDDDDDDEGDNDDNDDNNEELWWWWHWK